MPVRGSARSLTLPVDLVVPELVVAQDKDRRLIVDQPGDGVHRPVDLALPDVARDHQ